MQLTTCRLNIELEAEAEGPAAFQCWPLGEMDMDQTD